MSDFPIISAQLKIYRLTDKNYIEKVLQTKTWSTFLLH